MLEGILEGPWSDSLHKEGPAQGVTQPGLESLGAQMETAHGLGRRLRWLYFSVVHKLAHQRAALLLPRRNNVPILSHLLLTFLFTRTSSFLYLDEFRLPGNGGFIGTRIQGHVFHQQC